MTMLHWRILYFIILALPLIDILTMLTVDAFISFGAFFRLLLIVVLFFYVSQYLFRERKGYFIFFTLAILSVAMTFTLNYFVKEPFYLFSELQFYMKTIYLLLLIFYLIVVSDLLKREVATTEQEERFYIATNVNGSIVSLLYWVAVISGTSLKSYPNDKAGYSGWYFAANELSVIIVILFAFALYQLWQRQTWPTVLLPFLLLCIAPLIGTKTAFFGVSLIALLFLLFYVRKLQVKVLLYALPLALFYFFFLYNSPIMYNLQPERFSEEDKELLHLSNEQQDLLSSRDTYVEAMKADFHAATVLRKLFGLGYAADYKTEPKMAEMDFYDLFFSYGIIGTVLLLIPFVLLFLRMLTSQPSDMYILLFFTFLLCIGVAYFVGHVLFAPAVSSYVALLVFSLLLEKKKAMHAS